MNTKIKPGQIPQVDKLLTHPVLQQQEKTIRRDLLAILIRRHLQTLRDRLKKGCECPSVDMIARDIAHSAQQLTQPSLKSVINGTGIILSTNLGRAPLAPETAQYLAEIASGYCCLEIDLHSGKRGQRNTFISDLLKLFTGCEASLVVNNNAAAVMLIVNTLSAGKETIISRGELIEIGGSFRLPDVISAAGAQLKEVGTTNRTRISDYRLALSPNSGLLLKCHRSNFEIQGFTEEATLEELSELGQEKQIPFVYDAGSTLLLPALQPTLDQEPNVQTLLGSGCNLVTFSADKLLAGPQAGIIVGSAALIERLHRNPFYRALRVDKLTMAALESTLRSYLSPNAIHRLPALVMLTADNQQLRQRAHDFCRRAQTTLADIKCEPVESQAKTGGGSLPGHTCASYAVALSSGLTAQQLSRLLRNSNPPIIGIIQDDRLLLDLRTVSQEQETLVLNCLQKIESSQLKRL